MCLLLYVMEESCMEKSLFDLESKVTNFSIVFH